MTLAADNRMARVVGELTPAERDGAAAYLATDPVDGGRRLALPGIELVAERRSLLVFVDQDPTANWGHPARYILLACDDVAHSVSVPARLPPFGQKDGLHWQLVYRADAVPESAIVNP